MILNNPNIHSSFARWAWQCFTKCYNPKIASDCNLGKDLRKNKRNDQLIRYKNTIRKKEETWECLYYYMSGMVHTRDKSPQDGLGVVRTCGMTLASAYVLHCLFTIWSQLQMIRRSLKGKWALIWYVAVEHWRLSSIRGYLHWLSD